jgi:hypothetical protein
MRITDYVNSEGILCIVQSIPSPKAELFKRWLAKIGYERIQEIENPELAQERMKILYEQKGYSKDWIDKPLRGIAIRQNLTDEWQERGIDSEKDYAILTAEISKATFGMTPNELLLARRLSLPKNAVIMPAGLKISAGSLKLREGRVAKWLCRGLQSPRRRFDSGLGLQFIFIHSSPGGEIGRRKGLKIPRPLYGHAGSIPALGTINQSSSFHKIPYYSTKSFIINDYSCDYIPKYSKLVYSFPCISHLFCIYIRV